MNSATDKSLLRRQLKDQGQAISIDDLAASSLSACARMLATPWFTGAHVIMLYAPIERELDVTLLAKECERTGRRVVAPRANWEDKSLEPAMVHRWESDWEIGRYGIRQPKADAQPMLPGEIDLIVVPGLAFDRNRMRLGRGAGLYDRFLARADVRGAKIGIGFDWQLLSALPANDHDQRLDAVVVESEVV